MSKSVFDDLVVKSYPFQYDVTLEVGVLVGGIPSDPKVAESWLRSKIKDPEANIQEMVAKTMVERGMTSDEAVEEVNLKRNLSGFKRGGPQHGEHQGELYVEGRQLKAMLKEAVGIAVGAKKISLRGWGETKKFLTNYFPEHVFIVNQEVWLGVKEPTDILQQFVHTRFGSSIQYQEFVKDVVLDFHLISDHPFTEQDWGMLWTTGERNGLGASRSQSFGTFKVIRWDQRKL